MHHACMHAVLNYENHILHSLDRMTNDLPGVKHPKGPPVNATCMTFTFSLFFQYDNVVLPLKGGDICQASKDCKRAK